MEIRACLKKFNWLKKCPFCHIFVFLSPHSYGYAVQKSLHMEQKSSFFATINPF
ncbi:MAG: hypothetical protein TRG1_996 [Flavobacteriaceae bacterium FS1-H7996/R]|nr:MAG: hypothetical protein TRG1_996 [Flavobacteriaceae bacterium FS1-H7996/R]